MMYCFLRGPWPYLRTFILRARIWQMQNLVRHILSGAPRVMGACVFKKLAFCDQQHLFDAFGQSMKAMICCSN